MSIAARIVAGVIRTIGGSLRHRFVLDDLDAAPQRMKAPAIYTFWHESLLLPAYTHSTQIVPLISQSTDGTLIDEIYQLLGGQTIRGSTDHGGKNRGGRSAMREMLRILQSKHIGIPLDGPVGPRRTVVSPGVSWVASQSQSPIIPCGIASKALVSLGPGDMKIDIPLLFTRVWYVVGKPFYAPPNLSKSDTREFVGVIQSAMDDAQARAETYIKGDKCPQQPLTLREFKALD